MWLTTMHKIKLEWPHSHHWSAARNGCLGFQIHQLEYQQGNEDSRSISLVPFLQSQCSHFFASLFISEGGQPKSQSAPLSSSGKPGSERLTFLAGTSIVDGCGEDIADKVHELIDVLWLKDCKYKFDA
jgi:hypothetical protein